jgi:transcriptional regulator with XRE-family HTH domain
MSVTVFFGGELWMLVDIKQTNGAMAPVRSTGQVGADFRALRRARGWPLSELAAQLDRSVGWLSQVERGVSEPALEDVRRVAALFNLPVSFFFSHSPDTPEAAYVVRADSRRKMSDHSMGLVESLLSPDLGGAFEIVHSVFDVGAKCPQPFVRPTEEAGYVIEGSLTLIIDDQEFVLNAGDSFRFAGETVSWVNQGAKPAVLIWVIAPPVY